MKSVALFTLVFALAATPHPLHGSLPGDGEWAKNVPYTTDWNTAIKSCQSTGKLLLVYNGWERRNV